MGRKNLVVIVIVCSSLGMLAAVLLPPLSVREAGTRVKLLSSASRIAIAMRQYANQYGTLPPAALRDTLGRPMHSWRALLLPFLDQPRIAALYKYDQAWDSPTHLPLLKEIPDVFASGDGKGTETAFVVVVGEGTAFSTVGPTSSEVLRGSRMRDLTLIIAVERSGIGWTEPRDAELDAKSSLRAIRLGSDDLRKHLDLPAVAGFADGSARTIREELPDGAFSGYFMMRTKSDGATKGEK